MSHRGLFYGWVVLAAAATAIAVALGALFSLGVFLKPIEDTMGWTRSEISVVALINWIAMGLGSFFWGALSDRLRRPHGPPGRGPRWSPSNRGLAGGVVSAGIGLGTFLIAPLARALTNAWGWRGAMLVLGDLAWLVVIPVALLIRNAPAEMGAVALGGAAAARREYTTREVVRAPQFWAIALTHLACCAAPSGPVFHMG